MHKAKFFTTQFPIKTTFLARTLHFEAIFKGDCINLLFTLVELKYYDITF